MKHLKKFESFVYEGGPATAPTKPSTRPGTKPGAPTKPQRPVKPETPGIEKPEANPDPKAKAKAKDVAERFITEVNKKGESVKKYMKK
jgi:hypothetical protein